MKVLVACEYSGRVRESFRKLGHDTYSCDLLPSDDNSNFHFECDVKEILNEWMSWATKAFKGVKFVVDTLGMAMSRQNFTLGGT